MCAAAEASPGSRKLRESNEPRADLEDSRQRCPPGLDEPCAARSEVVATLAPANGLEEDIVASTAVVGRLNSAAAAPSGLALSNYGAISGISGVLPGSEQAERISIQDWGKKAAGHTLDHKRNTQAAYDSHEKKFQHFLIFHSGRELGTTAGERRPNLWRVTLCARAGMAWSYA